MVQVQINDRAMQCNQSGTTHGELQSFLTREIPEFKSFKKKICWCTTMVMGMGLAWWLLAMQCVYSAFSVGLVPEQVPVTVFQVCNQ